MIGILSTCSRSLGTFCSIIAPFFSNRGKISREKVEKRKAAAFSNPEQYTFGMQRDTLIYSPLKKWKNSSAALVATGAILPTWERSLQVILGDPHPKCAQRFLWLRS